MQCTSHPTVSRLRQKGYTSTDSLSADTAISYGMFYARSSTGLLGWTALVSSPFVTGPLLCSLAGVWIERNGTGLS